MNFTMNPKADSVAVDQAESSISQQGSGRRVVADIFGQLDTTPWPVLWLALAWGIVEVIPGSLLLFNDLTADQPTGESLAGAFFSTAAIAAGSIWVWWTMMGSMPPRRRWQILAVSCVVLMSARFLVPSSLLSLVAVFAWTMVGVIAVSLSVRYLLGITLEPWQSTVKGELTIWLLLRYTLAAAVLAWFTRSIASDDDALLSTLEIVSVAIPIGILVGLISFILLWILARKYRWVYIGLLFTIIVPITAATALYFAQQNRSRELLIAAMFIAAISLIGHVILFGLPLIARGFRFHHIEK